MSSQTAAAHSDRPGASARLVGIDLARFLAICGMVVAHVRVIDWAADKPLNTVFDGNPSTLFAVLGGVSVVLATRRYLVAGDVAAARWSLFARGGIVVLIGLLLGLLEDAPAVVVLVPFGVAMWGAIPFLRVRSGAVLGWAAALIAVTPVLIGAVSAAHESGEFLTYEDQGSLTFESFAEPVDAFRRLLITGSYPALTWLGVVLLGMLVARGLLAARDRGTERRFALGTAGLGVALAAAGLGVAAWAEAPAGSLALDDAEQGTGPLWIGWHGDSGWAALLLAEPHTGTVPDVARGVGIALVVIAACLLLTWALPGPALTALRPVTAAGAAPLTAYTAHILLLNWLSSLEPDGAVARFSDEAPWWLSGGGAIALHLGMVLALGALLAALGRRGPLETLTSTAASLAASLSAGRRP